MKSKLIRKTKKLKKLKNKNNKKTQKGGIFGETSHYKEKCGSFDSSQIYKEYVDKRECLEATFITSTLKPIKIDNITDQFNAKKIKMLESLVEEAVQPSRLRSGSTCLLLLTISVLGSLFIALYNYYIYSTNKTKQTSSTKGKILNIKHNVVQTVRILNGFMDNFSHMDILFKKFIEKFTDNVIESILGDNNKKANVLLYYLTLKSKTKFKTGNNIFINKTSEYNIVNINLILFFECSGFITDKLTDDNNDLLLELLDLNKEDVKPPVPPVHPPDSFDVYINNFTRTEFEKPIFDDTYKSKFSKLLRFDKIVFDFDETIIKIAIGPLNKYYDYVINELLETKQKTLFPDYGETIGNTAFTSDELKEFCFDGEMFCNLVKYLLDSSKQIAILSYGRPMVIKRFLAILLGTQISRQIFVFSPIKDGVITNNGLDPYTVDGVDYNFVVKNNKKVPEMITLVQKMNGEENNYKQTIDEYNTLTIDKSIYKNVLFFDDNAANVDQVSQKLGVFGINVDKDGFTKKYIDLTSSNA